MKIVDRPIGEDELQAYIDGQLDAADRTAVEVYLAARPEVAARVSDDIRHRDALRAALAAKADEPVPPRLRIDHIARDLAAVRRRRLVSIASTFALLMAGGAAGWTGKTVLDPALPGHSETMLAARPMADALMAHRVYVAEVRHPIEVGADQRDHLQAWLSKRVGRRLTAPDLSASGYRLLGGRLLPAATGPAALFMYQTEAGARLTLYVRGSTGRAAAPVRLIDDKGLRAGYWYDGGYGFAVAAEADREAVLAAARSARRQLRI